MTKATVTRLFVGSLVAVAAGAILAIIGVSLAIANGVFVMSGPDVTGINQSPLAWALLGIGIASGLVIVGGLIGGLVAWIGALLNTAQLQGKTWFIALLLLGIFNFGFLGMIAYVIAGPNSSAKAAPQLAQAPA